MMLSPSSSSSSSSSSYYCLITPALEPSFSFPSPLHSKKSLFFGSQRRVFRGFSLSRVLHSYSFTSLSDARTRVVKAVASPDSALELPLTAENVETVLDEVRPYLIADGGNVALHEIDGNVVRLKLQGACGSCPSSTTTMKLGIERRLMEKIPEIVAVEAVPDEETGLELNEENIEKEKWFVKLWDVHTFLLAFRSQVGSLMLCLSCGVSCRFWAFSVSWMFPVCCKEPLNHTGGSLHNWTCTS